MRSTLSHIALLLGTALLLAGCSPSRRPEPSDADSAAANPSPRSSASEEKPSAAPDRPAQPSQSAALPDAFSSSPPSFAPLTPSGDPLEPRQPVAVPGEPPLGSSLVEPPGAPSVEAPRADRGDHLFPPPPGESRGPSATPTEGTLPSSSPDNPLRAGDAAASDSDATRPTPLPSHTFPTPPSTRPRPTGEEMTPAGPIETPPIESPPAESPPAEASNTSSPPADPPAASLAESAGLPDSVAVPSANPKNAGEETDEETFDPIKENGPIFVGWTKPKLAVVITGREDGYIEPCGCAGLDKMKGGLSRRHTMIESLREKGWPVVTVDVGGFTKGYGRQTEIKFQSTIEAMRKMEYDAIGFGANDLRLPAGELVSVAAEPSPFVSANVGLFGFEANLTAHTKILDANGLKVGVTAVLGKSHQGDINNQEIELAAPEEAIARVLPELKKKCNLLVLLAHATKDEAIALGEKFPEFQVVVTAGGPAEPPSEPLRFPVDDPRSLLIEVGEKGMNAVVLGFYDDPREPVRYQRVPLDSRFEASRDMYRVMVAYQEQLKRQGLAGLNVRPVPHPQGDVNGEYVGSEACKSCHEESYRVWKKSGHAKGWKTLVELDPPRNFDPECISCHVIGWHPTKYFPYESGFVSEEKTPHLINVGCETCHGPGGAHCRAEEGSDFELQEKLYAAVRVTKEESQTNSAKMCQNCHDLDNSPDFDFETYWPKVEHYEDE